MLSISTFNQYININLRESNDNLPTLKPISENIIEDIVEFIKELFHKLKEFLFGESQKTTSPSSSSSSSSGYRNSSSPYNVDYTNGIDENTLKSRMYNNYFISRFNIRVHNWDNRTIDNMSYLTNKLDTIRITLPDGTQIDSSAVSIVSAIVNKINAFNSGEEFTIKKEFDCAAEFKDSINRSVERVFAVSSDNLSTTLKERAKSSKVFERKTNSAELRDMYETVKSTQIELNRISAIYRDLAKSIQTAENKINNLHIDEDSPNSSEFTHMIKELANMLQYKVKIINSVEHIHIQCIKERANEYRNNLISFTRF